MNNLPQVVNFHNQSLLTLEKDGVHYVAVRPIAEGMGLDWKSQSAKLKNPKFSCGDIATTGKDGKTYKMLCMPIKKLNGWLFSINPDKVRPEIKDTVIQYQDECFEVLHDYWHKGEAINPRRLSTVKDRNGLNKIVNWAVKALNMDYNEVCNMVNFRFNTTNFSGLTLEQVEQACEYLQNMILDRGGKHLTYNQANPPAQVEQPVQPLMVLPAVQNVTQGKFVGAFDEYGRLTMRQLREDEFITTAEDLPLMIRDEMNLNMRELSEVAIATAQRMSFETMYHTGNTRVYSKKAV